MDTRSAASKTVGDKMSRSGCEESNWVVRVRIKDVEWTFCGNAKRRRPVMNASASGMSAKRRKLEYSTVSDLVRDRRDC